MRPELSFRQTQAEQVVRIASSLIFDGLRKAGCKLIPLSSLTEDPQYGFTASADSEPVGPKFVRITDLQDGRIRWERVPYCECPEPTKYLLKAGDLLFARTGATTGKTHLVESDADAVFASYLIRVRPLSGVRADYLYSFFQSDFYWSQIIDEKEGSAQPNVNGRKLMTILIPSTDTVLQGHIVEFLRAVRERQGGVQTDLPRLPPPIEGQRRIVERLTNLFGRIEGAIRLAVESEVAASVLCDSELARMVDKHWQAERPLSELLSENSLNGLPAHPSLEPPGHSILRISAATTRSDFTINESESRFLQITDSEAAKYSLQPGDLLACRFNGNLGFVGRFALYTGYRKVPQVYPDKLIRFRIDRALASPEYISLVMNSKQIRATVEGMCATTAGNIGIAATDLKTIRVPVPPLMVQEELVARFRMLQGQVGLLMKAVLLRKNELCSLMPSIVSQAFSGQL